MFTTWFQTAPSGRHDWAFDEAILDEADRIRTRRNS